MQTYSTDEEQHDPHIVTWITVKRNAESRRAGDRPMTECMDQMGMMVREIKTQNFFLRLDLKQTNAYHGSIIIMLPWSIDYG